MKTVTIFWLLQFLDSGSAATVALTSLARAFAMLSLFVGIRKVRLQVGRAIAQAVSRWLPTAAASHVGFVVDKVALGQVFSEYFGFPFQFSFHQFISTITIAYHPGMVQ
jgi:hypothetical protein